MIHSQLVKLVVFIVSVVCVGALDCSKDGLENYKFKDVFTVVAARSQIYDTPPSNTNFTWFFNLCGQSDQLPAECAKNSQICGIQQVSLPGKEPIITEIISFGNGLNYKVSSLNDTDVEIQLDESSWGTNSINANLNFHCGAEVDGGIHFSWDDSNGLFTLHWNTPGACLKTNKEVPTDPPSDDKPKDGKEKDDSWGWFTWLFIILVLVFGSYIVLTSWISSSRTPADFNDAVHDFIDTLKSLPALAGEIFQKIVGTSDRGGYSAV